MRTNLTDISVRALKYDGTQRVVWDAQLPGFGVRVGRKTKTFTVMVGKRRERISCGHFPETSLADARKAARKIIANHTDRPHCPTLGEALERYYSVHFPSLRASTAYNRKGVLERHFRRLEGKELGDLTPGQIVQILDGLTETPTERRQAWKELRTFLRWCVGRQYLSASPCELLKAPPASKPRDRVLTDDELVKVWQAAERTRPPFGTIVRLLILTGQRRGETALLRPEHVDHQKALVTLPADNVKNGRMHTFPLGPMAAALLPPNRIGLYFPAKGRPQHRFNGFSACKNKLAKASGVDFSLHDLRRTFASKLAELGVAPHVVERLLNHSRGQISGVAAIYNRYNYMSEMRDAIALWEAHLTKLLANNLRVVDAA